ncbi:MAG: DUF2461 domain-containing protein [Oscillospiraceae bacterium]|nr:DUF2461 domain-containing protein [Oscillospiraceae bacterium]
MFEGFSERTVDFMWGIRLNNNKPWFEQHKDEYKRELAAPMQALAQQVSAAFFKAHPEFELTVHVARIYRDARRLFGNGPYKDHLWFTLQPLTEEWTDKPAFWFELGPDDWTYGLGYYMARPLTMAKHRARIDSDPKPLARLQQLLGGQSEFVLEGERYKKPKGERADALAAWYNLRSFSLIHTEKLTPLIASPALADRLLEGFDFLAPFYAYFGTLDADPDPKI